MRQLFLLKILVAVLCLQPILCLGFQVQKPVTGVVRNADGELLPGVSISISGGAASTSTKTDGTFSIPAKSGDVLYVTAVGYTSKELTITNEDSYEIVLEQTDQDLSAVVVVGYGTQKKVNLSGAVDVVRAKELQNRPIVNVAQGLQGMVPNLNIRFTSGAPGQTPYVNIRGITSINGGDPLIMIDGVQNTPAELNLLAPQDIESMSVIKDASAAAIYGARAAFGVILITTKTGASAKTAVNYSNNFSLNKPTVIPKMVTDPYVFSRLLELSTDNTPWDNVNYSDQYYDYAKQRSEDPSIPGVRINPSDPTQWEYMGNRDWARYFFNDYTLNQIHDISVSGSSENNRMRYYLSGGYNKQNSALAIGDDFFNRYSLRAKVDYSVRDWLKIGNNTFYTHTNRRTPSQFDPYNVYTYFPTAWDKNPDGTWANTSVGQAAALAADGGVKTDKRGVIQSTFTGEASFWNKLLTLNADYTFRNTTGNINNYQTAYKIGYGPDDVREQGTNAARRDANLINYKIFNIYGTLSKKISAHAFTAVLGYSQESYRSETFWVSRGDLVSAAFPTIGLATGLLDGSENINTYALQGVFGRLNYIFDDKYIVEINGRYDGSSRFPRDKRFGFFPSASAAWRVDRENFMQPLSGVIDNLKLRASYGSLGNQALPDEYSGYYGYIPNMATAPSQYLIGDGRPLVINPPSLVSGNYTWETVNTTNFGVDLGLFKNRFTLTFDMYTRNTLDMLTAGKQLPDVLGADEPNENAADLRTKGWELSIDYQNTFSVGRSPLSFNARFIMADSKTEITRFDNPTGNITQYYKGMELGEIWGLESNGLFQDQGDIDKLDESAIIPWSALAIVPGWPKYVDRDGNGKIEKGYTLDDTKDLKVIGNTLPRYQIGLDLNANWKGFDMRVFFQGVLKRNYYPLDYLYFGFYQQPYGNIYEHMLDFYRPADDSETDLAKRSQSYINMGLANANPDAKFPILQAWMADANLGTKIDEAMGLAIPQTNYLLSAAYLRIKNVTLGYTLPRTLTERIGIAGLRVYASGENIFEWSAVKDFFDPETTNENINPNPRTAIGRKGNGMTYPFQRSYSAGINLTF